MFLIISLNNKHLNNISINTIYLHPKQNCNYFSIVFISVVNNITSLYGIHSMNTLIRNNHLFDELRSY